jgi:hypothetical protein
LSRTCPGTTPDKKVADAENISYPPGTVLYNDAGFQGYEPAVCAHRGNREEEWERSKKSAA